MEEAPITCNIAAKHFLQGVIICPTPIQPLVIVMLLPSFVFCPKLNP